MNTVSLKKIRFWTYVLIIGLIVSGITAINPDFFLHLIVNLFQNQPQSAIAVWLNHIYKALIITKAQYPFLLYGYDWLAFAHILLGILFIGVIKDPHHAKWLVQFGMIACALIIPFVLCFGYIRGIPVLWQLVDSSFAVGAMIPLRMIHKHINIINQKPIK